MFTPLREDNRQARPPTSTDRLRQVAQVEAQHIAPQDQQRAEGLVLRRGRDAPTSGQVREKPAHRNACQRVTRPTAVPSHAIEMPEEPHDPVDVGLLGARRVVTQTRQRSQGGHCIVSGDHAVFTEGERADATSDELSRQGPQKHSTLRSACATRHSGWPILTIPFTNCWAASLAEPASSGCCRNLRTHSSQYGACFAEASLRSTMYRPKRANSLSASADSCGPR